MTCKRRTSPTSSGARRGRSSERRAPGEGRAEDLPRRAPDEVGDVLRLHVIRDAITQVACIAEIGQACGGLVGEHSGRSRYHRFEFGSRLAESAHPNLARRLDVLLTVWAARVRHGVAVADAVKGSVAG